MWQGFVQERREDFVVLVNDLLDEECGEELEAKSSEIAKIKTEVEKCEEGVDELKDDEFVGEVVVMLLLGAVVLPCSEMASQLGVFQVQEKDEQAVGDGRQL